MLLAPVQQIPSFSKPFQYREKRKQKRKFLFERVIPPSLIMSSETDHAGFCIVQKLQIKPRRGCLMKSECSTIGNHDSALNAAALTA